MNIRIKRFVFSVFQLISFDRLIWRREKGIYLTFDDGPHENTIKIIDILKEYGAKATFFVTGDNVEKRPETIKMIIENGFTIGNHTYTHFRYNSSVRDMINEINRTFEAISKIITPGKKYFRFPYGVFKLKIILRVLFKGYKVFYWSIDSKDSYFNSKADGVRTVKSMRLKDGDIVLFHDDTEYIDEYIRLLLTLNKGNSFLSL